MTLKEKIKEIINTYNVTEKYIVGQLPFPLHIASKNLSDDKLIKLLDLIFPPKNDS